MTTNLRLMRPQYFCKEANTNFIVAHKVEQSQTRVVGERAEEAIHIERLVLGHTPRILP